jgi:hypothetical protein
MWNEAASKFKFDIGAVLEHTSATNKGHRGPTRFVVIERVLIQCHGGIQRHYACRTVLEADFGQQANVMSCTFNEDELRFTDKTAAD